MTMEGWLVCSFVTILTCFPSESFPVFDPTAYRSLDVKRLMRLTFLLFQLRTIEENLELVKL